MNYFAVDSGTTNSRVWLMRDLEIVSRSLVPAGVRNTAIDGNNRALMQGIRGAISELKSDLAPQGQPEAAIAAGMITSNLGLHEVKHRQAPAGVHELAAGIQTRCFEEMDDLQFHFIPGVRSGPSTANLKNVNDIDIMRGEETEVIGALDAFHLKGPLLYIHLGSHTKLIQVDGSQRISGSASTLAGELLHSIHQQTILRSSLPESQELVFNEEFFNRGWEACQRVGLTRTLYQVRIFDLNSEFPKEDLFAYLVGAMLHEEFLCLRDMNERVGIQQVILSGLPNLQPAWLHALEQCDFSVRSLSPEETEHAFLAGLLRIFRQFQTAADNASESAQ